MGAGPGDPGLITVKGLERLRRADVVVYDALANPSLLNEAPARARRIDVGKRAKAHTLTQDQTNELLANEAAAGNFVVRLKGGDPYLFGRGAEEAAYLAHRGIRCEVIPGITSGLAAPATAGIPVTHRKLASTVTLVTGHEDPTKGQTSIDYKALADLIRAGGTVCFYMGVGRLDAIAQSLHENGLPLETPMAAVQWGTLPTQKQVRSTLAQATAAVTQAGIGAPAIIVVGAVAAIDEPGLDDFTARPLFGQRVLITRTRQQASELRTLLEEQGALVHEAATIQLQPPADWHEVDGAVQQLPEFDWLVLTSANAMTVLSERLTHLKLDARHLGRGGRLKIAVIGDATEAALWEQLKVRADLVPTRFVAESLAGELIAKHGVHDQRALLLRADIARPELPKLLTDAGAKVTEVVAYQTRVAEALEPEIIEALRHREIDWVTFTSSSTASNLVQLLGAEATALLQNLRVASIGPITSQTLHKLGIKPTIEATTSNVPGLVEAMCVAAKPS